MPMAVNQPSFAKGELSPSLHGRVDTAAYQVGLKTARNATIHAYGGVSNRVGTVFSGPVKDHADAHIRLIPFQFNVSDTYMLEFGDQYMRVLRNNSHVLEDAQTIVSITQADPAVVEVTGHGYSNGDEVFINGGDMVELTGRRFKVANVATNTFELTDQVTGADIDSTGYTTYTTGGTAARIFTLATPYLLADLPQLSYVQSADVMTLTLNGYDSRELSRTDHDAWTLTAITFEPDQAYPTGQVVTPDSGASTEARYRVTAIGEDGEESLPAVENGSDAIEAATQTNPVELVMTAHTFVVGDEIEITGVVGMTQLNNRRFRIGSAGGNDVSLQDINGNNIDGTGYTAYSSGGTVRRTFVVISNSAATRANTISVAATAGAVRYAFYYRDNGIYGLIGESETTSFKDANIEADTSVTPPQAINPFFDDGAEPAASGYFEQRRFFGGTLNKPDTWNASKIGNHSNFTKSRPTQDGDAIEATLNAQQVNQIRHFVAGNDLLVLTSGSEWRINAGQDSGFSASTVKQKPQSNWGSSYRKPITVGTTTIFVQENDALVRSLGYSLQIDGYTGSNMSLLAEHLLRRNTILDWAFARFPDPVTYMVRDDGKLLTMTFDQEQEVIAWTTWDTKGKYEAVGVVRSSPEARDDTAYFVVRRKINGNTVRYIEYTASRNFADVRDCFFVDSGLSLDAPKTITNVTSADPVVVTAVAHGFSNGDEVDIFDIEWEPDFDDLDNETQPDQLNTRRYVVANKTDDTFELNDMDGNDIDGTAFNAYVENGTVREAVASVSGLEHLANTAVVVLADGNVLSGLTVSATGILTLPRAFSRIHVGLRYITDIETLNIERQGGTIQGKTVKIPKVTLRLDRSRGLWVGNRSDDITEVKFRENEAIGDPTALFTGDKDITLEPRWNSAGRLFMRQRDPLPLSLLAVIPTIEVGSR